MKKNVVLSESRELPLLLFLWKWKLATTAALIHKFFPNCAGKTAYNRILALRQAGLICIKADGHGQSFIYALDTDGFRAIRDYLPFIKEEGFKSEHLAHDLIVSAFHLGNWITRKPEKGALFSEQELRRTSLEYYPDWIPRTDIHRPDGYSLVPRGNSEETFAIEVELHYKKESAYSQVAEFYSHFKGIKKVLWLVPQKAMAAHLNRQMKEPLGKDPSPHNFVTFEEFRTCGWDSKILLGPDQDQRLSDLLPEGPPQAGRLPADASLVKILLDTRKSPHLANTYRGFHFGDFVD